MKLIIDIPEEKFNNFIYGDSLDDKDYDEIVDFIAQGTLIPDNATNEGLLLVLYKDERLIDAIRQGTRDFLMYQPNSDKWVSWLDAPYKEGE